MSKSAKLLNKLLTIEESIGTSEEGWCLVMANNKVTGTIYPNKEDAIKQQKKAPVATKIKWGKRAADGEYIATRAVDPVE